jgi:hypothetical protein
MIYLTLSTLADTDETISEYIINNEPCSFASSTKLEPECIES